VGPRRQFWFEEDTRPLSRTLVRNSQAAIKEFLEIGLSIHNKNATNLRDIIRHCETHKIPYTLRANLGDVYTIERLDNSTDVKDIFEAADQMLFDETH
jgi:hypothetical protein